MRAAPFVFPGAGLDSFRFLKRLTFRSGFSVGMFLLCYPDRSVDAFCWRAGKWSRQELPQKSSLGPHSL